MKATQVSDNQVDPLEEQLIGINAKTAPYPAARSWSGGRKRILGKEKKMPGKQCLHRFLFLITLCSHESHPSL